MSCMCVCVCVCVCVCECVLECDPHDVGIAVSYCFVLHIFFAPNGKSVFLACILLSIFYTLLMGPN